MNFSWIFPPYFISYAIQSLFVIAWNILFIITNNSSSSIRQLTILHFQINETFSNDTDMRRQNRNLLKDLSFSGHYMNTFLIYVTHTRTHTHTHTHTHTYAYTLLCPSYKGPFLWEIIRKKSNLEEIFLNVYIAPHLFKNSNGQSTHYISFYSLLLKNKRNNP